MERDWHLSGDSSANILYENLVHKFSVSQISVFTSLLSIWISGVPTNDVGDNDEFTAVFNVARTGTYDYAWRFSADEGLSWSYCDLNGLSDGYSPENAGHLTVTP